jgi:hypothetical protein
MTPCASAEAQSIRSRRPLVGTDGAITVMTAIVTILILSLILVSLESARQQGAVAMLRMHVQTAAESVLGEYYAPLFDDYGLYGLYDVDIEEEIRSCLETSGRPEQAVDGSNPGESRSYYSYAYDISEVALKRTVDLLQGGGALCKNQMIEEGAVSGIQELAELLLSAVKLLKDSEASVGAIEMQQRIQLQLALFEEKLLRLMQLIDGVHTTSGGIVFQPDGKPQIDPFFAKRAVTVSVTQENVHMGNRMIYERLEPIYTNLTVLVPTLKTEINKYLSSSAAEPGEELMSVYRLYAGAVHDSYIGSQEAVTVLEELIELQDRFRPMVKELEKYMQTCQPLISEDMYKALEETMRILKNYVGIREGVKTYDFEGMKEQLLRNLVVLSPILNETIQLPRLKPNWAKVRDVCGNLDQYSVDKLELEYSSVRKTTAGDSSFWSAVKTLLTKGITVGVYPKGEYLSMSTIRWEPDLPSRTLEDDPSSLYVFPDLTDDGEIGIAALKKLLQGNLLRNLLNRLADGIVDLSEKLLLVTYFATHMSDYTDKAQTGVLRYEQEYLLFGKNEDSQNQRAATLSILGIRVLMNVIHVFSDSLKNAEAMGIAAELLSAVPVPILIKVAQYLILTIWALQNAYLETAEILQGKSVPLVVTSGTFQLNLAAAFTMTHSSRIEIAKMYKPPEGLKLGYEHYLLLLMMMRSSDAMTARALDLIQVNIREKYDRKFLIKNCVYGFELDVKAEMPTLYTTIPLGDSAGERGNAYTIEEGCAVSY